MAKRKGVSEPKPKTINGRSYWHCRVSIGRKPDGTLDRQDVYADNYEECVRKRNAMMADVDKGTYIDPARMTVAAWLTQWMDQFMTGLSPSTRAEYQGAINRHIIPGLGARQLSKLTMMDCQRFINSLDLASGSVRNIYSVLHNALETARKARIIPFNPSDDLTLPQRREKERPPLSAEMSEQFIEALRGDPYENMFIFMLETGVRIGEARGLRWTSINFKQGEVRIVEQLTQQRGKDNASTFTPPKCNSKRTLYPTATAMNALKAERARQREKRKQAGSLWTDEYGLVFTRDDGTPIPYRTIDSNFKRIGKQIGVPDLSAHRLRHTYATDCNDVGISAKTVASSLGHKNAKITVDRYTHDSKAAQQAAAEKLQSRRKKMPS